MATPPMPPGSNSPHVQSSSESNGASSHTGSGGSADWKSSSSPASLSSLNLDSDTDVGRQLDDEWGHTSAMRRGSVASVGTSSSASLLFEMSGSEGQRSEAEEEMLEGASGGVRALSLLQMPSDEERMDSLSSIGSTSTVTPEVTSETSFTFMMDKVRRWRERGWVKTELLSSAEGGDKNCLPDPTLDQAVVVRVTPLQTDEMDLYFNTEKLPSKNPFVVKVQFDPIRKQRRQKITAKHKTQETEGDEIQKTEGDKTKKAEKYKALKNEADILRDLLSHENIVRFVKADSQRIPELFLVKEKKYIEANEQYLIMEDAGVDLRQYLAGRSPQDMLIRLLYSAIQLMHGLEYLEENEIVHCDIKPENLLVGQKAIERKFHCLKIADFGFAYDAEGGFRGQVNKIEGSLHFMAPELKRVDAKDKIQSQTYATDIYSAGMTLAVMLLEHKVIASSLYRVEPGESIQLEIEESYKDNPLACAFVAEDQKLLNKESESRPTAEEARQAFKELFDKFRGQI